MVEKKSTKDVWIKALSYDIGVFLSAFFLMFALALVRKDVHSLPAIGYWASFGIVWATSIAGALLRGMPKDTK